MPAPRDFWEQVNVGRPNQCWPWLGFRSPKGYGRLTKAKRSRYAHHVAWELSGRARTPGTVLHHSCENPACCNPRHLDEVTAQQHKDRHARTHCRRGHELTPANVYWDAGYRRCRICKLASNRASRRRGRS